MQLDERTFPAAIFQDRACPTCGTPNGRVVHTHEHDRYLSDVWPGRVQYRLCENCATVYQSPSFRQPVLEAFYRERARGDLSLKGPDEHYYAERHPGNRKRIALLERDLPEVFARPQRSVLDIGCAGAGLLNEFKARGFRTFGVEPTKGFAVHARDVLGHEVLTGFYDAESFAGQKFDVIVLSHVLEHLEHPERLLSLIRDKLKPDGWLYVEVPDLDSIQTGPSIAGLLHGQHVQMFTAQSLRGLLQHHFSEIRVLESIREPEMSHSVRAIVRGEGNTESPWCSGMEVKRIRAMMAWCAFRNRMLRPLRAAVARRLLGK